MIEIASSYFLAMTTMLICPSLRNRGTRVKQSVSTESKI